MSYTLVIQKECIGFVSFDVLPSPKSQELLLELELVLKKLTVSPFIE